MLKFISFLLLLSACMAYDIVVFSPVEGEIFHIGDTLNITLEYNESVPFTIVLNRIEGNQFQGIKIASNLEPSTKYFLYDIPKKTEAGIYQLLIMYDACSPQTCTFTSPDFYIKDLGCPEAPKSKWTYLGVGFAVGCGSTLIIGIMSWVVCATRSEKKKKKGYTVLPY